MNERSLLGKQCQALCMGVPPLSALSNVSACVYKEVDHLNWVGFYFAKNGRLELACFQGKPACALLPFDRGVCAKSYREDSTVIIKDVHEFSGHIACDSASNSELVLPLHYQGRVIGVLDIDSDILNRFNEADVASLTAVRDALETAIDWQSLQGFLFD